MLRSIVGFEMPIDRIEGKFKLSQNRPEVDQIGVMRQWVFIRLIHVDGDGFIVGVFRVRLDLDFDILVLHDRHRIVRHAVV